VIFAPEAFWPWGWDGTTDPATHVGPSAIQPAESVESKDQPVTRVERRFVTRCDGCARRRATVAAFRMLHGTPFFCRQCWTRLADHACDALSNFADYGHEPRPAKPTQRVVARKEGIR